ncbi:MAG: AAA family ATPase [Gemmataceae bacterium]
MRFFSRTTLWLALTGVGASLVVLAILFRSQKEAVATGIVVVMVWIGVGWYLSWLLGLRRQVVRHLGPRWNLGEVLRHRVRTAERVNIQLALDLLQAQTALVGPFGIRHVTGFDDEEGEATAYPGSELPVLLEANPEPVGIIWEPMPISTGETLHCASNGVYFLRIHDEAVVAFLQGTSGPTSKRAMLQVMGRTQEIARRALDEIVRLGNEQSPYRGQVISLKIGGRRAGDLVVQFHTIRRVEREHIVLPPALLTIIERNILGFFRHAEALRAAGQDTRHGVLLHGPPGTGKTLVTRYLATNVGATVLLVNGRQYAQLRATCQLARLLAPSLVILEDVDLVAADRRRNAHTPLLHELLDEMDGITAGADIVFLLTTNRPEVLEPALAARPGRVDQAIYFPLPDLDCRRRLFQRFGQDLDLEAVDFEPFLVRTEGASPAFLRELFRRATLLAVERQETQTRVRPGKDDFEQAIRELVEVGGPLTRTFLGFPTPSAG